MKLATRKKIRALTTEQQKTGGGVVDPKFNLSEDENLIFEICGAEYFSGDNQTNEIGFSKNVKIYSFIC